MDDNRILIKNDAVSGLLKLIEEQVRPISFLIGRILPLRILYELERFLQVLDTEIIGEYLQFPGDFIDFGLLSHLRLGKERTPRLLPDGGLVFHEFFQDTLDFRRVRGLTHDLLLELIHVFPSALHGASELVDLDSLRSSDCLKELILARECDGFGSILLTCHSVVLYIILSIVT